MFKGIDVFNDKATLYSLNRPRYSNELVDYLYNELRITPQTVIADIGSGTGILSHDFLKRGNYVIGVEPNDEMRNIANKNLIGFNKFKSVKGTAENTTIDNNSVDVIVVGQAFHWFDKNLFKQECYRICNNQPYVALIWNKKDSDSLMEIERQKIRDLISNVQDYYNNNWNDRISGICEFFNNGYTYKEFENNIVNDFDTFIGRSMSDSRAPRKDSPLYETYIEKLTDYFKRFSKYDILTVPNKTIVFCGKLL